MAALPIAHDWSEFFGKDRRQRRQVSGGVVGDAKERADCVLIPRLGIDSHANPALFRQAARRRRRRLLLSVDAPAGSGASDFVKRRRPVGARCPRRHSRPDDACTQIDRGGHDPGLANPNRSHSTPEAWILLRDMLLGLSRRRRQQVKDLCNDIDAVNGPSILLV